MTAPTSRRTAPSPRRIKGTLMIAVLAASALTLISWTQPWFSLTLIDDEAGGATIEVAGDVAAGGLAGLGLAGLALVGALSIAGPLIRVVLGVLQTLIGAVVVLSATVATADPVVASATTITEATGIAGADSVARLVDSTAVGFWPYAAAVLGVSSVVLGALIVTTSRRWPGSSRKYGTVEGRVEHGDDAVDAVATPAVEPGGELDATPKADPVADWDALSDGSDPTSR